jgi:hypothetical protein
MPLHIVAASAAFNMTIGLVLIFLVGFPVVVNVLIGFMAAQMRGEHEQNREYERRHPSA